MIEQKKDIENFFLLSTIRSDKLCMLVFIMHEYAYKRWDLCISSDHCWSSFTKTVLFSVYSYFSWIDINALQKTIIILIINIQDQSKGKGQPFYYIIYFYYDQSTYLHTTQHVLFSCHS